VTADPKRSRTWWTGLLVGVVSGTTISVLAGLATIQLTEPLSRQDVLNTPVVERANIYDDAHDRLSSRTKPDTASGFAVNLYERRGRAGESCVDGEADVSGLMLVPIAITDSVAATSKLEGLCGILLEVAPGVPGSYSALEVQIEQGRLDVEPTPPELLGQIPIDYHQTIELNVPIGTDTDITYTLMLVTEARLAGSKKRSRQTIRHRLRR
jgi:hypothetical protein